MASVALAFSPSVMAADMVDAKNPKKIADLIDQWADDVQIKKDDKGDPLITFKYMDVNQIVAFYGCKQNKNCKSLQFISPWKNDGKQTLQTANRWNQSKRFVRMYLDKDNDVMMEMDVDLEVAVPTEYLRTVMKTWQVSLLAFAVDGAEK
nr:YbjN domain-containing protein [Conchiformibius kuhniae]